MKTHDATEVAYKNGYKAGYEAAKKELVHCSECEHLRTETFLRTDTILEGVNYCGINKYVVNNDSYCYWGKRVGGSYQEATEKQKQLIADMMEFGCPEFIGKTKQEASEYIDKHMEYFKLQTMDGWALAYM